MKHRDQNSLDQVLLELATSLFLDLQKHHPHIKKELQRDLLTLSKRVSHEGVSFLTQTLPTLSKAVYTALETGLFVCPSGFTKRKGTALPRFTGGLLKRVFNDAGMIVSQVDESSLVDSLQIYQMFYKLELPYSPNKVKKVIDNFIQTEEDLKELTIEDDQLLEDAADLCFEILKGFDPKEIIPRHGPGAVATRERTEQKWIFKRKYNHIHKVYPYYDYFVPSRSSLLCRIQWYKELEQLDSGTARVVLVPKDSRGPRLISMEPLEYQFIQQGIARSLMNHLENKSFITRGFVNFTDQRINQNLALYNSCSKSYSTLDMKEASDRVSLQLVQKIFKRRPDVLKCIEATRTTHTELPNGQIIRLEKFAPMGSALCFPVESLIFFILCEVYRRSERLPGKCYVYGDDLIVPNELSSYLFEHFPKYGLMFNTGKSFTNGYFRESCGLDAYKGFLCKPVRMKKVLPTKRQPELIVSGVDFSNRLYQRGYWESADYVKSFLQKQLDIRVLKPIKACFGGLAYDSFSLKGIVSTGKTRFNKDIQVFETLSQSLFVRKRKRKELCPQSSDLLFQNLVNQRQETYVVPHTTKIKMRWCYLYG